MAYLLLFFSVHYEVTEKKIYSFFDKYNASVLLSLSLSCWKYNVWSMPFMIPVTWVYRNHRVSLPVYYNDGATIFLGLQLLDPLHKIKCFELGHVCRGPVWAGNYSGHQNIIILNESKMKILLIWNCYICICYMYNADLCH